MPAKRSEPSGPKVPNADEPTRRSLQAARTTINRDQKKVIAELLERRDVLVREARLANNQAQRMIAVSKIKDIDECVLTLRHQLKHMNRSLSVKSVRSGKNVDLSCQSDNLPKVLWAKPYRG